MHPGKLLTALVASGICLSGYPAPGSAHHGGAVEWLERVDGPLTGTATDFAFRFPHVLIYLDVETTKGIEQWVMNTRWTPTILRRHGWTRESIRPGDTVTVTYEPHISAPTVGSMLTIEVNGTALPLEF